MSPSQNRGVRMTQSANPLSGHAQDKGDEAPWEGSSHFSPQLLVTLFRSWLNILP